MKRFLGVFSSFVFAYAVASCPSPQEVEKVLEDLTLKKMKVETVKPLEELGLCVAVVKSGLKPLVIYVDKDLKYLISGNLIDIKKRENLTAKIANEYQKVSQEVLKELEQLTDLRFNQGAKKFVYFISDPDCPYCRKLEPILKKWAKENDVEIRHIFFPLPMHPKAKEKAIDIICSGKGYEYVHKDFEPKNLCEEGKKKIEKNIQVLSRIGVTGTPTLIGMNGKVIVGLPPSEEALNELIK
ncbi:MAG: DsbC family protein [Aquificae bacterium]|nr:DsbC family protein [Aquificota bacterium]